MAKKGSKRNTQKGGGEVNTATCVKGVNKQSSQCEKNMGRKGGEYAYSGYCFHSKEDVDDADYSFPPCRPIEIVYDTSL